MCKINVNQIVELAEQLREQSTRSEATNNKVAEQLRLSAKRMREEADQLDRLAANLVNGLMTDEPAGRKVIVLKEGERHPKASAQGRRAKKRKPKYPISEQRRLQLQEQCRMMRERKQKQALVEHFAETKIS